MASTASTVGIAAAAVGAVLIATGLYANDDRTHQPRKQGDATLVSAPAPNERNAAMPPRIERTRIGNETLRKGLAQITPGKLERASSSDTDVFLMPSASEINGHGEVEAVQPTWQVPLKRYAEVSKERSAIPVIIGDWLDLSKVNDWVGFIFEMEQQLRSSLNWLRATWSIAVTSSKDKYALCREQFHKLNSYLNSNAVHVSGLDQEVQIAVRVSLQYMHAANRRLQIAAETGKKAELHEGSVAFLQKSFGDGVPVQAPPHHIDRVDKIDEERYIDSRRLFNETTKEFKVLHSLLQLQGNWQKINKQVVDSELEKQVANQPNDLDHFLNILNPLVVNAAVVALKINRDNSRGDSILEDMYKLKSIPVEDWCLAVRGWSAGVRKYISSGAGTTQFPTRPGPGVEQDKGAINNYLSTAFYYQRRKVYKLHNLASSVLSTYLNSQDAVHTDEIQVAEFTLPESTWEPPAETRTAGWFGYKF